MACRERLEAYFTEQHVPFQVQHHPAAFSAQRIAESEHVSSKMVTKEVIAVVDNKMVALVLPASYQVDLDKVRVALGAKDVRLAHEEEFAPTFADCQIGAIPPFGNLYGLPVYVEMSLANQDTIIFPAGTCTETMSIKYADFERLVHPQVTMFAKSRPVA